MDNDIDLIEQYLDGKLNPGEIRKFNLRLEDDREFARKFRVRQAFPELLKDSSTFKQQQTKLLQNEQDQLTKKTRIKPLWLFRGACSIVVIGLIICILLFFSQDGTRMVTGKNPSLSGVPAVKKPAIQPSNKNIQKPVPAISVKAIELVAPDNGAMVNRKEEIRFTWIQATDSLTCFYICTKNSEKPIFWRGIKRGIREYRLKPLTLRPGNYFWYVGNPEFKSSLIIE